MLTSLNVPARLTSSTTPRLLLIYLEYVHVRPFLPFDTLHAHTFSPLRPKGRNIRRWRSQKT